MEGTLDFDSVHLGGQLLTLIMVQKLTQSLLGCANKDLWALCAPIFIIVVYCKTATSYFLGGKE